MFAPVSYFVLDLKTAIEEDFRMFKHITDAYFLSDSEVIILGIYDGSRGLYKYHLDTEKIELLLDDEANKYINNFTFVIRK